ncbi:helix-turn-helix domain-containing protein [Nonomuraea guangzhouensis]|uniref:Helix-turn-helix domain-containing protein n=1 Tax=Nonomuraea guangzhouensis TaxID=1291555 RepID=A0ABW4FZF8_9ACTN|nr:helix-turn-helix domain-containing protein [Nonomuraea guangzhouensis]
MSDTWTIRELAEHAADALRAHAQPLNGRVRDVPGERLIRWYTTIGLVDPPLTRRGRIAQYGRRHLLQLVAIKRLQAAGRSIAEIQTTLTGATDATLERTAHPEGLILDEDVAAVGALLDGPSLSEDARTAGGHLNGETPETATSETETPETETPETADLLDGSAAGSRSPRGRFWTERPTDGTGTALPANGSLPTGTIHPADALPPSSAAPPPGAATPAGALPSPSAAPPAGSGRPAGPPPPSDTGRPARVTPPIGALVRGVRLADGVTLLLDGAGRTPAEDDIQAVLAAAAPLLALLEERKLI